MEHALFALPVKLGGGGLGIIEPSKMCNIQYQNSLLMTESLVKNVVDQKPVLEID